MKMELVLSPGRIGGENKTGTPFENEEVREWSHVDRLTGMLEHARIETGRWQTRHQGTAQAYGKVIDSRERNSADGNVVQKARRQVEVFQSQGIGGRSVQVVRASQWSSSRITDSTTSSPISVSTNDAAAQPIRNGNEDDCDSLAKLSQVSRLCRQINGGESIFNGRMHGERSSFNSLQERTLNSHMLNKSSVIDDRFKKFDDGRNGKIGNNLMTNNLKSTSNEDLTQPIDSNIKSCQTIFTRDCKARRSLQIQKSVISETEYNGRSRNKNDDLDSTRELLDNKKLKSYVLGMEEEESINDRSDALNSPKTIIDKKFIFNGSGVAEENGKDVLNSEYLRPTPILIKPKGSTNKSNTTVVHLNNKLFLDRKKGDGNKECDAILTPETATINNLTTPIHSRVQSLANRFTNGHNLPIIDSIPIQRFSNNDIPLTQTEIMINNSISSSRIEGLINRSAALVSSEGSLELLSDKKLSDDQTVMNNNKPIKRVGFCKTEVHFAAESGKVNIVETDCKPPPSNRFRRRRRNSVGLNAPIIGQNKNLPLIHFGDTTYEKYIFGQSSSSSFKEDRFNALNLKDEVEPSDQTAASFKEIESHESHDNKTDQRLSSSLIALDPEDKLMAKNGLRGPRIKTILQSEPKPPIIVNDAETEEVSLNFNKNFHQLDDETIVDHSFKGSHTTTVNLGANVTSKLQKHTNNEDIIDDELDIVNSDLPTSDEICFESIKTVEKNFSQDDIISEFSNVVTSDNENNKVLMNIVKTHEPVLARVEEMTPQNNIRTRLSSMKNITNETNRSKKSSSSINTNNTVLKPEAKDDNCDIKTVKEIVESKGFKNAEDNPHTVADPTYVNVFENAKKSVPIYENYRVNRKRDTLNDKMKYSKKSIKSTTELNSVKDSISKTTNGIRDNETILSNTDCTEEDNFKPSYSKSRESDLKLATISEMNNLSIRNNNRDNQKVKSSKIRSKKTVKTVRPPSSTSSIESVNQNSLNDAVKDCEARPTHTKSTRSSRLRRVTNSREIQSSKDTTERYSSNDRKNQITSERTNAAIKNDQSFKNSNDGTRSKKPIEIVYETAVFNMKNEKLSKSSKTKESRTPRYINDLICGIRPKRDSTDVKHVKETGTGRGGGGGAMTQRAIRKSVSPANRHWK